MKIQMPKFYAIPKTDGSKSISTDIPVDILIPSCKPRGDCEPLISEVASTRFTRGQVIFTGTAGSAAENRNLALERATTDWVIMLDDDIGGFFSGWDLSLISPLYLFDNISVISARLLKPDGSYGAMTGDSMDRASFITLVTRVPSACIAFFRDSIKFDENYAGSGFEDTDFCMSKRRLYPDHAIAVNNNCRLIHKNEMKNQLEHLPANREYYESKWGPLNP